MRILFLTHRLPYAPNRGDRIRAFHELRELVAAGHDVHVVSLVHDRDEADHARDLDGLAASVRTARVPKRANLLRGAPALLSSRPLTHALLSSPLLRPAIENRVSIVRPQVVLAYCSSMARYAFEPPLLGLPCVVDMVDVDSEKWATLARATRSPLAWVYAREAEVLGRFEGEAARRAMVTYVVNQREASALRRVSGPGAAIEVMENGVDLEHLRPQAGPGPSNDVVFCGVMSYGPNEDGALWVARAVWPAVRKANPQARLLLVGADPTWKLRALASMDRSIVVTGSVPDVRPYLWNGCVAAAPLRVARGVQNKVLEAVAAGLPAVVTPVVADGLPAEVAPACLVAHSATQFAAALSDMLGRAPLQRRAIANSVSLETLNWRSRLSPLMVTLSRLT